MTLEQSHLVAVAFNQKSKRLKLNRETFNRGCLRPVVGPPCPQYGYDRRHQQQVADRKVHVMLSGSSSQLTRNVAIGKDEFQFGNSDARDASISQSKILQLSGVVKMLEPNIRHLGVLKVKS